MAEFENLMNEKGIHSWSSDASIVQLFTLAHEEVTADDALYKYMTLDIGNSGKNEFVEAKGGINGKGIKEYLQLYSELKNIRHTPISLSAKHEEKLNAKKREEEEAKRLREERLREERRQAEEEAERKAKEQEEKEKIARNRVPLSEKIKNSNKFNTLFGNVKSWLRYNEMSSEDLTALREKLFLILEDKKIRRGWDNFSRWKDLSDLIGEEICKQWFDAIKKKYFNN